MLTLQVIAIMDSIWNREGMDLRMMPYNCLATGSQVLINPPCQTRDHLFRVPGRDDRGGQERRDSSPNPEARGADSGAAAGQLAALQVDQGQQQAHGEQQGQARPGHRDVHCLMCGLLCGNFILRIGDRHPDNIMVNEDGQIFHIDLRLVLL